MTRPTTKDKNDDELSRVPGVPGSEQGDLRRVPNEPVSSLQARNENSHVTKATCPRHIWIAHVEEAAMACGVSPDWLREPLQRQRIHRAYTEGESVWMEAAAVCLFWRGFKQWNANRP